MPRLSNSRASDLSDCLSSLPRHHDPSAETLALLRRQWKWAAFTQFFCTFSQLFAMDDVTVSDIERDLVYHTLTVLPRVMQRLLYVLSYDRKVSLQNWQNILRKQYNKRDPGANPIGPLLGNGQITANEELRALSESNRDESCGDLINGEKESLNGLLNDDTEKELQGHIDWLDLPLLSKLESMHTVTEWQFQNPMRLRALMKSDDELALWRIEPIGYDSKRNAYWFIGGDRLWIQREPPKVRKPKSLKRKLPPEVPDIKTKSIFSKRTKIDLDPIPSIKLSKASHSSHHDRVAKKQAKLKLDIQAKELQAYNMPPRLNRPLKKSQKGIRSLHVVGTRTSARLKGTQQQEWQTIPEDWLDESLSTKNSATYLIPKTGLESGEEATSELTELSDETDDIPVSETFRFSLTSKEDQEDENQFEQSHTDDFIEWETICVTIQEWEKIPERFATATNHSEKALHKILVNNIVPFVIQDLKEIGRKREMETALVHRKKSSRIALKESEREAARLAAKKKQEEEEKSRRARRNEVRQLKEEEERSKREYARIQRRKEHEAQNESKMTLNLERNEITLDKTSSPNDRSSTVAQERITRNPSGSHSSMGEDWELCCEICQCCGINLDDGTPMMSCSLCSKWQHILCHDRADLDAGREPRNWDSVDFVCKICQCQARQQDQHLQEHRFQASYHVPLSNPPRMPNHRPFRPFNDSATFTPQKSLSNLQNANPHGGSFLPPLNHYQPVHAPPPSSSRLHANHHISHDHQQFQPGHPIYSNLTGFSSWNFNPPMNSGYSLPPNATSGAILYRNHQSNHPDIISVTESSQIIYPEQLV